jgi:expansin
MRLAHPGDRHPGPRQPRNGNRIWLVTSVVTVLVMVFVAVKLTGSGCPAASRAGGPTAGGGGSAAGAGGSPSAGGGSAAGASGSDGGGSAAGASGSPSAGASADPDGAARTAAAGSRMASPLAARPALAGSAIQGHAVFYDPGHAAGSCGLGPFPARGQYASLPRRSYASGRACGSYVDVSGPAGTVQAEVVDVCPDCAAATVDLSRAAFSRIADPRTGTVAVSYQPAVDPPLPGPLELRITAAGPPGSLAVQVLNHGNRLSSVAASGPGGRWQRLVPGADGYWTGSLGAGVAAGGTPGGVSAAVGGAPAGPGRHGLAGGAAGRRIRVRITDVEGHQVVLTGIPPRRTVVHATVWMYRAASRAVPPATRSPGAAVTPARRARAAASAGSC